ncbi:MAG: response regulator, partial [Verrucomicrobia bacterium]|nr:response regulator [Verrucomicrobiota bacterium]
LVMRRLGTEWDAFFVKSGPAALELMSREPVDIVVSDMHMPEMTGAQLLNEVMRRYPRTVRLILTGHADEATVLECVGTTHQWLSKPCSPLALQANLRRIRGLQQRLANKELQTLVAQMTHLPTFPALFLKISEVMQSPHSSIQTIGELVWEDPALTAKVLQLANSAAFGATHSVDTADEAVQMLGVNLIRSLALAHHLFTAFQDRVCDLLPVGQIWEHSLQTAFLAQKIVDLEPSLEHLREQVFTAGILHDIGQLALAANLPDQYARVWDRSRPSNGPSLQAEREMFQATHADVGAYLLGIWGLPVLMVEAVAWHHEPAQSADRVFTPLTAVHVANALVHAQTPLSQETFSSMVDARYLDQLGLSHRLGAWSALRQ